MCKGVYIELFHGRSPANAKLHDWGSVGPIFGPFEYFHTTYACEIKFGEEEYVLSIKDGMVFYDGVWYGDWSVFSGRFLGNRKMTVFEQEKAKVRG